MDIDKLIESLVEEELVKLDEGPFDKKEKVEGGIELTPGDLNILTSLEQGLENEINRSVELEENVVILNDVLQEAASSGGFAYEGTVIKALKRAGVQGNMTGGAGASAAAPDADFNVFGTIYPVEVKLDSRAQMGGSSVRYARGAKSISLVKELEPETAITLIKAVKGKKSQLDALLTFLLSQEPNEINSRATKFPCSVTKDAWTLASKNNLLVNVKLNSTTGFIERHYAKKGVHYIQIGGAGLFHLKKNPANLPVPRLDGEIQIEIRSARSGSKKLSSGFRVVGGGIRVQGRLKTKNISPYTLDDPKSILEMLKHMAAEGSKALGKAAVKKKSR